MSESLEPNQQIILAAISATGPKPVFPLRAQFAEDDTAGFEAARASFDVTAAAWDQQFKANAREIKVMFGDRSKIGQQLAALDKALTGVEGKVFIGTIVRVDKESSSQRALVTLFTGTDREAKGADGSILPAGHEQVRTDRTDNLDGRAIARSATQLVGHRVAVYVELEAIKNGTTKVRVARHFGDEGTDPQFVNGVVNRPVNAARAAA
jgi:hypothetical protein